MTHVLVISRSPLFGDGLAAALSSVEGWQVRVAALPDEAADVLVMHAHEAEVLATLPESVPLVLIGDDTPHPLPREAQRQQALALLSPSATPQQLRAAVGAVLQGLSVRQGSGDWGSTQALVHSGAGDHEPLTPREIEVYEFLAKGLSNRDIAGVLDISVHTAKYHVSQILGKVDAATRAEAVSAGLRMGIIGL